MCVTLDRSLICAHPYTRQALAIGLAQADTGGGVADAAMSASSGD